MVDEGLMENVLDGGEVRVVDDESDGLYVEVMSAVI